jgi:DNA-binding SARP family transcriptional activator/tetratricopeptide (TPR) repeat protein
MLHVRLLGGFEAREGDTVFPFAESVRAQALLAYLIMNREGAQPRQRLAFLLWPDSSEAQARTNLRHVLYNVRHTLRRADRFLDVSPHTLHWKPAAPFWLDVSAFEGLLVQATQASSVEAEISALRDAVGLYTSDLLDGFFDDWVLGPRERLRQRYLRALERLTSLLAARGDHADAIVVALRLSREDPLHEEPYRMLMRLYAATGDRARAIRVYHTCVSTLQRELEVLPSAATVETYEAVMAAPASTMTVARPERVAESAFVGRTEQMVQLKSAWEEASRGRAHLVLVSGEPGVGKTRLVEEFAAWCGHHGVLVANGRAYAAEGALAYGLLIAWLNTEWLQPAIARLSRSDRLELARLLPVIAPDPPPVGPNESIPQGELRRRLFDVAARALLAPMQPVLIVADDIHCADPETLQFLHYLLRVAPAARLLVVVTARRETLDGDQPLDRLGSGLYATDQFTEINLKRLTGAETATLASRVLGRPLDVVGAQRLHAETEGLPLFVVETLRAGWVSDAAQRSPQELAPKLQAVIRLRLGQLSTPARDLVGVAAAIGREFPSDVLAGSSDGHTETFVAALDELWRRGIIREQGTDGYDFSHDKIREFAYADLSAARRRHYHARIAETLARLSAAGATAADAQIATHFERAGRFDDAVAWYLRASEASQAVHATSDAIRLLGRALDLLGRLPETAGRTECAVQILSAIPALIATVEGFTSSRTVEAQHRAIERSRALGIVPAPPLLLSLAMTSLSRGEFEQSQRIGAELTARGEREADQGLIVEGHYLLGITAFWSGEFSSARNHFEKAVECFASVDRSRHLIRFGRDPQVLCLGRLANTLGFMGHPGAQRLRDDTVALAQRIGHPFSHGTALIFGAMLSLELREFDRFRHLVTAVNALPAERQSPPILISSRALLGLVQVFDGRTDEGLAHIERAFHDLQSTDAAPGMSATLSRLQLAAHERTQDAVTGLAAADRAIAMCSGVRTWEAEARRLRAIFLGAVGGSAEEVEAEFGRALATAERQGAALLALRTAVSLARHRFHAGAIPVRDQARALLKALLTSLPEAVDLADYRDALNVLPRL